MRKKRPQTLAAENNLWQTLRPRLQTAGFFCQRIETSTGEGIPDLFVGKADEYVWLELKAQKEWPVRDTSKVFGKDGLRQEQINWHIAASQKRLRAGILAGVGVGAKRQLFLVPSTFAEQFNDWGRPQLLPYLVSLDKLPSILQSWGKG